MRIRTRNRQNLQKDQQCLTKRKSKSKLRWKPLVGIQGRSSRVKSWIKGAFAHKLAIEIFVAWFFDFEWLGTKDGSSMQQSLPTKKNQQTNQQEKKKNLNLTSSDSNPKSARFPTPKKKKNDCQVAHGSQVHGSSRQDLCLRPFLRVQIGVDHHVREGTGSVLSKHHCSWFFWALLSFKSFGLISGVPWCTTNT